MRRLLQQARKGGCHGGGDNGGDQGCPEGEANRRSGETKCTFIKNKRLTGGERAGGDERGEQGGGKGRDQQHRAFGELPSPHCDRAHGLHGHGPGADDSYRQPEVAHFRHQPAKQARDAATTGTPALVNGTRARAMARPPNAAALEFADLS